METCSPVSVRAEEFAHPVAIITALVETLARHPAPPAAAPITGAGSGVGINWPALPVALADTIGPDFPLVNKSFNLYCAGNDL